MKMFLDVPKVYLHKQPVDFRKSINGLSLLVEQEMQLSPFSGALFVFCNQQRTRLKVLYWDSTRNLAPAVKPMKVKARC